MLKAKLSSAFIRISRVEWWSGAGDASPDGVYAHRRTCASGKYQDEIASR
jgi:hypothetical protein